MNLKSSHAANPAITEMGWGGGAGYLSDFKLSI